MNKYIDCRILLILMLALLYPQPSYSNLAMDFLYSPTNKATIENRQPTVTFCFGNIIYQPDSCRLLINKKDVTSDCIIIHRSLIYKPRENLPLGDNNVEVSFLDNRWKKVEVKWSFYIREERLIESIKHNCKAPLMDGEKLNVTVKGKSGGKAFFSVGGSIKNCPLKETSSGVYTGYYTVQKYDYVAEEPIKVSLKMPDGSNYEQKSEEPVSIFAQFFRVKILSPMDGEKVCQQFTIRGRTKPNVKVLMTISLQFKKFGDFVSAQGPESGGIETMSDENGYFEKDFGFPFSYQGLKATIRVYALDSRGEKSMYEDITVILDHNKDRIEKEKKKKHSQANSLK